MVDKTQTDESCCSFSSKDSFEKVIAYYQTQLKTKALETKEVAAKYPALKANIQQLEKQLPPTMKFRAFVLTEQTISGQKGAEMFEVLGGPTEVTFSIANMALVKNDEHFFNSWREQMGQLSTTEVAAKKMVDWKLLKEALPTIAVVGEFNRQEVSGDTVSEGVSVSSQASVIYIKPVVVKDAGGDGQGENKSVSIDVDIEDSIASLDMAKEMAQPSGPTEKAIKIKGKYDGKQSAEKNESGYVTCEKVFLINQRFLVTLRGSNTNDLALLDKIIDSMNLAKLENLK